MDVIIVDLDSTLCDTRGRWHLIPEDRSDDQGWDRYSEACANDPAVEAVCELVRILQKYAKTAIAIVSGRHAGNLDLTKAWLKDQSIYPQFYYLRPVGDYRSNEDWKVWAAQDLRDRGHNILLAIDDWPGVREAYENIGIHTILVNAYAGDVPIEGTAYSGGPAAQKNPL